MVDLWHGESIKDEFILYYNTYLRKLDLLGITGKTKVSFLLREFLKYA